VLAPAIPHPRHAAGRLLGRVRRRSGPRGPRLAVCAALLAAAVVVGGDLGGLLAVFVLIVVVDALLPMPGARWTDADDHFRRQVRRVRRERRARRLRGLAPERLDVVDDRTGWASQAERRALGVRPIAVASLTATVEAAKAREFDRRLRPDRAAPEHWKRLWIAHAHGLSLPPVSVYRVGDVHVLRDGHHRASVARDLGEETIDADVVELLVPAGASGFGEPGRRAPSRQ
jgi:hypothetical protein